MITYTMALQMLDGWFAALYRDRDGEWRRANDARGYPLRCDSYELAHSVAGYRRRRLQPLEQ
jgi:hypothetical protein